MTDQEAYERLDELARKTVEGASELMDRLKAFDQGDCPCRCLDSECRSLER